MSKFRGGKRRTDGPSRANTGSSIRGRIGPPIPIPDDDEFPIRSPGTGIATPLATDGNERKFPLRSSTTAERDSAAQQASTLRYSQISAPSGSSIEKPQRKKSSLKSVFGRLFGKKRKPSNASNGQNGSPARQHRSVSS